MTCNICGEYAVKVNGQWEHEDKGQMHSVRIGTARPNSNYILSIMRDDDLAGDPFGTAMSWAYACAQNLALLDEDVPAELEYRPGLGGPVLESVEDFEVSAYLARDANTDEIMAHFNGYATVPGATETDHGLMVVDPEKVAEVTFAAKCLHRYIDWCKAAGRDY